MKILMYPHDLAIGGSQLNAIELAGRLSKRGHEVSVFGRPGPLCSRIDQLGLDFIASRPPRRRPSPAVVEDLERVLADGYDVVHAWEWPPILESTIAARQLPAKVVGTIMSMAVAPFVPRAVPLTVGTEQIARQEELHGRFDVEVLEPPVDLQHNIVDAGAVAQFRRQYDLDQAGPLVVVVTRLANELKAEGLYTAIDSFPELRSDAPATLVIVGSGAAETEIRQRADLANQRAGREAVVLTGELSDPRPAYAAADICLAMGGSALRALAFSKPLVVQGEEGFWLRLAPETVDHFLWGGWYGRGSGRATGAASFLTQLQSLIDLDLEGRERLARFGRNLVENRFDLDRAARTVETIYARPASVWSRRARVADAARSTVRFAGYYLDRRARRLIRRAPTDDFNAAKILLQSPKAGTRL